MQDGRRGADGVRRADATINSQATGAMSWAFIAALTKDPQQSYVELLNSVRELLEAEYEQRPQLSSSHPIGKSCPCFCFLGCGESKVKKKVGKGNIRPADAC